MTGDTEDRAVLYHQIDPAHKLLAGILRDTGKDQVESSVQVASLLRNGTGMGGNYGGNSICHQSPNPFFCCSSGAEEWRLASGRKTLRR